jgi:phage-related protein
MRPIILHPKARDVIRRFSKEEKTQRTPPLEIELARIHLKELLDA